MLGPVLMWKRPLHAPCAGGEGIKLPAVKRQFGVFQTKMSKLVKEEMY